MLKYDYFSVIENISEKTCNAAVCACTKRNTSGKKVSEELYNIYKLTYELEKTLFSDFLPPLERESIAAYAHSLCALADASAVYSSALANSPSAPTRFESLCCELSEILHNTSTMLKGVKKASDIPRLDKFRELKKQAFECHCINACGHRTIRTPQISAAERELLSAISGAFETLIEVMLKNI